MEILIISKRRGTTAGVRLSWWRLFAAATVVFALIGGAAFWGWTRGGDDMLDAVLDNPDRSSTVWQRELLLQRHFLNNLDRDMSADLSTLAVSVGRMQARLTRLEVAAQHVVTTAGLDAEEFAFEQPPPIGGPEPERSEPARWEGLLENLQALGTELDLREARLSMLEAFLLNRQQVDDTRPAGTPVADGWISSGYGYRTDPVNGRRQFHSGIDFAGKPGIEVRAAAPGLVTWSGKRWGYGNLVEISHGNGYVTRYAHNRVNLVSVGEKVDKNQPIALLGATGRVTGPHVHFEVVRDDKTVNPSHFVGRKARD